MAVKGISHTLQPLLYFLSFFQNQLGYNRPECFELLQVFSNMGNRHAFDYDAFVHHEGNMQVMVPPVSPSVDLHERSQNTGYQKYCRLCSVIYHVVEAPVLGNLTASGMCFRQGGHPGYPHRNYHIFIFQQDVPDGAGPALPGLAQATLQIHRAVVLIPWGQTVRIYVRNFFNDNFELRFTCYLGQPEIGASKLVHLLATKPNYEGKTLPTTVCRSCGDEIKQFRKTGKWYAYAEALMYYLGLRVNGTMKFIKITGPNWVGKDDRGRWSDWSSPLLNGSAAMASNQRYTIEGFKDFSIAGPANFIFATFVTARPTRATASGNLKRLLSPLSWNVWIGIIIGIGALFSITEVALHFHTAVQAIPVESMATHGHLLTLTQLLTPLIGQGSLPAIFARNIQHDFLAKSLLGIWLLLLIVLGSFYQSNMTSHIVAPVFTKAPDTFRELANSDYTKFAILWKNQLEREFKGLRNDYSAKLVENVQEFSFVSKECYMGVLQGQSACVGLNGPIASRGVPFMVDVYGQPLFVWAKESIFHRTISFGVSNYYRAICESLDWVIGSLRSTGLIDYWTVLRQRRGLSRGKANARENMKFIPLLSGTGESAKESIVPLLLRTSLVGLGFALCTFTGEILTCGVRKLLMNWL